VITGCVTIAGSTNSDDLRSQKLIRGIGISINRWEPWNGLQAVRSGEIDSVQVIYNIFDQNPEDELFPACHRLNVAIIARVPFDEGTLTGTLTKDSKWPEGDWRNNYFSPENLIPSVERAEKLKRLLAELEPRALYKYHVARISIAFHSQQR
jgi:aryl-alcohol dehydrogenase-like predicted oxidoreductase